MLVVLTLIVNLLAVVSSTILTVAEGIVTVCKIFV